ncbi:unnamed protein product [Paramecium pentaurelia]|uniref:Uncharacterized protein n=1 Tax=Paramecium pentaurelia TaxID=43138 RepID=A0A8S1V4C7_9CILI|nr:unnamed protein product [Paramecium pentaurelia]
MTSQLIKNPYNGASSRTYICEVNTIFGGYQILGCCTSTKTSMMKYFMLPLHYRMRINITLWKFNINISQDLMIGQIHNFFKQLIINELSLVILLLIQDQINVVIQVQIIVLNHLMIFHYLHQIQLFLNYTQIVITMYYKLLTYQEIFGVSLILRLHQMNVIKDVNFFQIQQLIVSCGNCGNNLFNYKILIMVEKVGLKIQICIFTYSINEGKIIDIIGQLNMLILIQYNSAITYLILPDHQSLIISQFYQQLNKRMLIIEHGNQMIQKMQSYQKYIVQMAQQVSVNYQQFFVVQQNDDNLVPFDGCFAKQASCQEDCVMWKQIYYSK